VTFFFPLLSHSFPFIAKCVLTFTCVGVFASELLTNEAVGSVRGRALLGRLHPFGRPLCGHHEARPPLAGNS
jgi:hypothetical protein